MTGRGNDSAQFRSLLPVRLLAGIVMRGRGGARRPRVTAKPLNIFFKGLGMKVTLLHNL